VWVGVVLNLHAFRPSVLDEDKRHTPDDLFRWGKRSLHPPDGKLGCSTNCSECDGKDEAPVPYRVPSL